ncbi:MAG: hypothetical protein EOO67_12975 [Microbacterium sp.]|nr:MAG: hypothetical protein EOO67_12975 [Microbacterium sp.]
MTLPTPVFVAGGALCLLAGYFVGTVAGPEKPERAVATVASFDSSTSTICLEGESVEDEKGLNDEDQLCGLWKPAQGLMKTPSKGDKFRFVSMDTSGSGDADPLTKVIIYGNVIK